MAITLKLKFQIMSPRASLEKNRITKPMKIVKLISDLSRISLLYLSHDSRLKQI